MKFSELKAILRGRKAIEKDSKKDIKFEDQVTPGNNGNVHVWERDRDWTTYGSKASGTYGYFEPKENNLSTFASVVSLENAKEHINEMREKTGKKVLTIDMMGTGETGVELGADKSIGWTLKDHKEAERATNQKVLEGDLLNKSTAIYHIEDLKTLINSGEYALGAFFFRAAGGYTIYQDNLEANRILYNDYLKPCYEIAPLGSRFYLDIDHPGSYGKEIIPVLESMGFKVLKGVEGSTSIVLEKADDRALPSLELLSGKLTVI